MPDSLGDHETPHSMALSSDRLPFRCRILTGGRRPAVLDLRTIHEADPGGTSEKLACWLFEGCAKGWNCGNLPVYSHGWRRPGAGFPPSRPVRLVRFARALLGCRAVDRKHLTGIGCCSRYSLRQPKRRPDPPQAADCCLTKSSAMSTIMSS